MHTHAARLDHPTLEPIAAEAPPDTFATRRGSLADRIGRRYPGHPVRVDAAICGVGFVMMALLLIGLGLLLTHVLLPGALERWDVSVVRSLVRLRTPTLNAWTHVGSYLGETVTVIGVALVATITLAIRKAWTQIGFLIGALMIEVSAFLVTTFLVDRNRPPVAKLDVAPPTSSFPSGHIAASIVLYVALAIIVSSFTRNLVIRFLMWTIAVVFPIAVAFSRLERGMHHPTDAMGSLIGAAGCLAFSMLAVRAAVIGHRSDHEPVMA